MMKNTSKVTFIGWASVIFAAIVVQTSALNAQAETHESSASKETAGGKIDRNLDKVGGYVKDSTITSKIKSAYVDDKAVGALRISVKTEKGIVTLRGKAKSQHEIDQAIRLAEEVEGVRSILNHIQISVN